MSSTPVLAPKPKADKKGRRLFDGDAQEIPSRLSPLLRQTSSPPSAASSGEPFSPVFSSSTGSGIGVTIFDDEGDGDPLGAISEPLALPLDSAHSQLASPTKKRALRGAAAVPSVFVESKQAEPDETTSVMEAFSELHDKIDDYLRAHGKITG